MTKLKSTPAAQLGTVTAPDEEKAIEKGAIEFKAPLAQYRLVARRMR